MDKGRITIDNYNADHHLEEGTSTGKGMSQSTTGEGTSNMLRGEKYLVGEG